MGPMDIDRFRNENRKLSGLPSKKSSQDSGRNGIRIGLANPPPLKDIAETKNVPPALADNGCTL